MTRSRFFRYVLRTPDTSRAQSFYSDVLGSQFWDADISLTRLPEAATARGAPAHWLGYISVEDVEATVDKIVTYGGQQLGTVRKGAGGALHAAVRDPFGAVTGIGCATPDANPASVKWHTHHGEDPVRTFASYAALFGWIPLALRDLGGERGKQQMFAWDASGDAVGSMSNAASLPHVHPHWQFFFPAADIEDCILRIRALGGTATETMLTADDDLVVSCEDSQGAAFALYQVIHSARNDAVNAG